MSQLSLYSVIFALSGAACTLPAALGQSTGFLGKIWSDRLYKAGYLLMFISITFFILKGFLA